MEKIQKKDLITEKRKYKNLFLNNNFTYLCNHNKFNIFISYK